MVQLAAVAAIPAAPGTLGEAGRTAWDRLWTAGQAWLSPTTDLDVLTRLCEAHDEREAMRDQVAADGYMVPGSMGQMRAHPLLSEIRAVESQITKYESLCGFTPTDRARLGYAEVRRASKLDELIARRQQRGSG
ncbi:gp31 [Streptantibioticus cattleyicolor NRRL 8057 = DSM 46488]|uniref:Gp31 n=1 Tax=Streptantibioticus cattleyicolor (strain ATCC 35852 / DSM 46488 / JCM 4925 / NBRC 14057 / NRRL 8057) TaxID=1003195 RepID=G8WPA6_STREN|nr:gp31 [Streptantibioticus cattleyicolor NRRL 8057 = DSM 46488]